MTFTKVQLKYKDYTWKVDNGDNPQYIGILDRIKLDRQEGYEVVCFANAYAKKHIFFPTVEDLHKIEDMLRNSVPSSVVMKDEIADFMDKNW
ncbi:hypothetical protein [Flavobacterium cerinum]|uniref:Uncharacterized protein n=1 Tax=Flavobacterium cerinum TaxID=2502784 RepID=A0A3S3QL01_9FLAO|nr:hypothetical protein [Flavobacterium cerinum]RWX00260.1 hypothetical protein EPI11_10305 [Flavobacterium cerinum]